MTDKNIKNFSDEELEEVAGGTTTYGVGAQIKKKQEKEAFVKEAKKDLTQKILHPGSRQLRICSMKEVV